MDISAYARGSPLESDKPWYHGPLTKPAAEKALQDTGYDSFMVRESEGRLVLSLVHHGQLYHLDVHHGPGWYELHCGTALYSFVELGDLVSHYSCNPLSDAMKITLGIACPKAYGELDTQVKADIPYHEYEYIDLPDTGTPNSVNAEAIYSKGEPVELLKMSWFHGQITEEQAEKKLTKQSFLVRQSSSKLFLSRKLDAGSVLSNEILYSPTGYRLKGRGEQFADLAALLRYYQLHSITADGRGKLGVAVQREISTGNESSSSENVPTQSKSLDHAKPVNFRMVDMVVRKRIATSEDSSRRRLFVFRHAERVDVTFGKQWMQLSYSANGAYRPNDLNMPRSIPPVRDTLGKDTPITAVGEFVAKLTGEGLRHQQIKVSHIYSSPALRCVQTAHAIIEGLQDRSLKIKVENGLFEWLSWNKRQLPKFMTTSELKESGMPVDEDYQSCVDTGDFKADENHLEFYKRMYNITRLLLHNSGKSASNILFVGHAAGLEACTRRLVGDSLLSSSELTAMVQKIPYCGLCVCEEGPSKWTYVEPPIPPLTCAPCVRFNWLTLKLKLS